MDCASLVISATGTEVWTGALNSLSGTSALAAAVKSRANVLKIAWNLRKVEGTVRNFLTNTHGLIEGKIEVEAPREPVTPQQMESMVDTLVMIARQIDYTHEMMRRVNLTNNSLTAGTLRSLVGHREGILDIADWIDASIDEKGTDEIFAQAEREKELGQVVTSTRSR